LDLIEAVCLVASERELRLKTCLRKKPLAYFSYFGREPLSAVIDESFDKHVTEAS
jgi:hypothetical protein